MTTTNNSNDKPTHRVYAVTRKDPKNRNEKGYWQPIGAAWAHGDGKGFTMKLELLPLTGADIVIREPQDKDQSTNSAGEI